MRICSGKRCPMQVGYDVENCKCEDCSFRDKPMTHFDRIKAMSVEEMAELIDKNYKCRKCYYYGRCNGDCHGGIKKWLESEV